MKKEKEFLLGCNYWASNAGCLTWRNFDREIVKKDLAFLASQGLNCLRIFPNWEDFQPIRRNHVPKSSYYDKQPFKMRINEQSMLSQKYESGLSEEKLADFKFLLNCAKENGMKVIVAFITGWMSGRYFVPEPFKSKDIIADPECILWQCAFIKDMIAEIKDYDNIIAWEPGNECNCLSYEATEPETELWLMSICNTIRMADPTRPVYSGMHGTHLQGPFNVLMQGKYFNVLTTHPYPSFTPYCDIEDIRQMRASLHSAIETHYYSALTGKVCMVEEINTLGPSILSDDFVPEYYEQALMTSLAVGTNGFLWWCGFEQDGFDFAPYDVSTLERNLGLASVDYKAKPVLESMKRSKAVLDEIGVLPSPEKDAVVLLPAYCDHWKTTYGASMLAVQNGRFVDFCYEEQPLKESGYYILPSLTGASPITTIALMPLIERVKAGAKLLITCQSGGLADFEKLVGLKVVGAETREIERRFTINGKACSVKAPSRRTYVSCGAEVLLRDDEGDILFTKNKLGKGEIYFFSAPLEDSYTESYMPESTGLYEVYKQFFEGKEKTFGVDSNRCLITTYDYKNGTIGVMVNSYDQRNALSFTVKEGYEVSKVLYANIQGDKLLMDRKYAYLELVKGK